MYKEVTKKNQTIRILILEDSPTDAELIIRALEDEDFIVDAKIVDEEHEFRHGISEFRPEIILSDYSLPTITGLEALAIATQECPEIPFVFITGTIGEEIAAETILNGAAGLILKSHLYKLPQTINKIINDESRWRQIRFNNAKERINLRIQKNQKALERMDEFITNRRTAKLSNEIVDDIKDMVKNLKGISNDLNNQKGE
ncbi:response regulator [Cellulophaga baltica]|uniref:response regulator n=1 Tax=Cellulophaga TaxID=104264 RepID=UPI001C079D93|nr:MULTISPECIES: response regulator [Cellulophaga]MBU2996926.1 response regulator [Cellulophaga baltica]MDO6768324.1 response regulator [Cellulophaga sp. 1_MG-2023]